MAETRDNGYVHDKLLKKKIGLFLGIGLGLNQGLMNPWTFHFAEFQVLVGSGLEIWLGSGIGLWIA